MIPCAVERTISKANMHLINCKLIVEGANGPVTLEAEKYLEDHGVVIVPDILINSGGVIVSYFEWLKNIEHISPGKMTKKF